MSKIRPGDILIDFSGNILASQISAKEYLKLLSSERNTYLAEQHMQHLFPGNYRLQQRYDSQSRSGYYYTIEWANEADQIMWLLRYSD